MADPISADGVGSRARSSEHEATRGVGEDRSQFPGGSLEEDHGTLQGKARLSAQELAPHHLCSGGGRNQEDGERYECTGKR